MSSAERQNAGLQALEREMRRLGVELGLYSQAAAEELGLNATDLDVLALLKEGGSSSAGQLASAMFLTTGAVTGVIDRLERAGYVRRGSDPQDRRRVVVELVSERADRLGRVFEPLQSIASELSAGWSRRELELVVGFVGEAVRRLHDETGRRRAASAPATGRSAESGDFSAPLGGLKRARLELAGGPANLAIVVVTDMDELYRAHFDGRIPRVRAEGGAVTVSYSRFKLFDFRRTAGRIELNPAVGWDLEVRGGFGAKIDADLSGLPLRSLEVTHGASDIQVVLPRPKGHVRVSMAGGASSVTLKRPKDVAVRLHMTGGASSVTFDAQGLAAIGGEINLESAGFARAGDRYDLEIAGGASSISVVGV
jgi:DNA-binding MarR family transcriptional regulator